MDYQKLHDSIIVRARFRQYNSSLHHNHHIIPLHEDSNSIEVVPLTFKEHYVVHHLRWKFVGTIGNLYAYYLLKFGSPTPIMASAAGKIGGAKTKETQSGIFSPSWNRGQFTKSLWESGRLSSENFPTESMTRSGLASASSGRGIYSIDYDRATAGKNIWKNLDDDTKEKRLTSLKNLGIIGSKVSKEMGMNFSSWDEDKHKEACSKGGKSLAGVPWWNNGIVNKHCLESPGDGWVRGRKKRKS